MDGHVRFASKSAIHLSGGTAFYRQAAVNGAARHFAFVPIPDNEGNLFLE
jgi:hypothetical protein